jgi:oxygen-independent coproporphyrinogen-3 oxidase
MQGTLVRNFQGYTTDKAPVLIGLGASAISALPQGYVQNFAAVPIYRPIVAQGQLPIQRGVALCRDDRIRRHVIERLMCDMAVDLGAASKAFGENPAAFGEALAALAPLAKQGIVSLDGDTVTISPRWRVATRLVCAAFDTYLAHGGSKHSVSV